MVTKIQTLTAVAALALAGTAIANEMSSVDKNADGKVTKAEAASNQQLSQKFDSLDANKDGNLDKGEFAKFEAKDSMGNKDGAPGKDEGDPAQKYDRPGTTDDSAPGNEDKLGPGR